MILAVFFYTVIQEMISNVYFSVLYLKYVHMNVVLYKIKYLFLSNIRFSSLFIIIRKI